MLHLGAFIVLEKVAGELKGTRLRIINVSQIYHLVEKFCHNVLCIYNNFIINVFYAFMFRW